MQSIDGARAAGREAAGRSTGSSTSTASRPTRARRRCACTDGDRVWWDRHDWGATDDVPAVVGSFPEPFLHGIDGKRLPVARRVRRRRGRRLRRRSQRPAASTLGLSPRPRRRSATRSASETLRVLVGPWRALRGDPTRHAARAGPGGQRRLRAARRRRPLARAARRARRGVARTLGAGRRPDRRDRGVEDAATRSGSSPAPTRPASPPRPRALDEGALHRPLRRRGVRRRRPVVPARRSAR